MMNVKLFVNVLRVASKHSEAKFSTGFITIKTLKWLILTDSASRNVSSM